MFLVIHPTAEVASRVAAEGAVGYCRAAAVVVPHPATFVVSRVIAEGAMVHYRAALPVIHPAAVRVSRVADECAVRNRRAAVRSVRHPAAPPSGRVGGERAISHCWAAFIVIHPAAGNGMVRITTRVRITRRYRKAIENSVRVEVCALGMIKDMVAVICAAGIIEQLFHGCVRVVITKQITGQNRFILIWVSVCEITAAGWESTVNRNLVYHSKMLAAVAYP